MQAVILAGGLGTRLWPLTMDLPKPLIPVAGRPYLEHQLLLLKRQRIEEVLLLTGYRGPQIRECFGDGARLGLCIRYSEEATPLGTGGAVRQARALLAEEFLLIYGDSYLPIDYQAVHGELADPRALGVLVVYRDVSGETSVKNNVALDPAGFVACYDKDSPAPGLDYVEAGVLALRRCAVDLLPPLPVVSLERELFPRLAQSRQLLAFVTTQRFYDIGTPQRLSAIERFLSDDHHPHSV